MSIRVNFGSGQRPFGLPRTYEAECVICGRDKATHDIDGDHRHVPRAADAWVNIDCQERWKPDAYDISVIPVGSAEIIVSHQQLEHVELSAADDLIRQWHSALKPGGSLLVFVPDMRAIATAWLEGRIDDYIFGVSCTGAWMGDPADQHRWTYWYPSLKKKLLGACKWSSVMPFDYRPIPGSDCARDWWILAVEAVK